MGMWVISSESCNHVFPSLASWESWNLLHQIIEIFNKLLGSLVNLKFLFFVSRLSIVMLTYSLFLFSFHSIASLDCAYSLHSILLLQMAEYRISIYGRKQSEWDQLASWIVNNELYSENVVWLIQVLQVSYSDTYSPLMCVHFSAN